MTNPFKARTSSGDIDAPIKGTHMGRVYGLVDLDHQPGFKWNKGGKSGEVEAQYKYQLMFELPNSMTKNGTPHCLDEDMKNSTHEKSNLYKRVSTIAPQIDLKDPNHDLTQIINMPCMIDVDINDAGYPKIKNITGVPAGIPVPELTNTPVLFSFGYPDNDVYGTLRKLTRKKLKDSLNFEGSALQQMLDQYGDPDAEDSSDDAKNSKY